MDYNKYVKFADKWMAKFMDPNIHYYVLVDPPMGEECKSLGFKMDCGHGFQEVYGHASNNYKMLQGVIQQIRDIDLLGSAIYSQWRYFNHWAYSGSEILEPKNRKWFITALKRLKELAIEKDQDQVDTEPKKKYEITLADRIMLFADKWTILFENHRIEPEEILGDQFEEEAKALGYRDEGHRIYEKCGKACWMDGELEKIVDQIHDLDFLGCMVYSNWLYFKKFSAYPEDILLNHNRNWFLIVFNRMQELILTDNAILSPVKKLTINTETMEKPGYSGKTKVTAEKVTINSQGRVWITQTGWNSETTSFGTVGKESFSIDKKVAMEIINNYQNNVPNMEFHTNSANWTLDYTREDGSTSHSIGPTQPIKMDNGYDLSEFIRWNLDRPQLLLLDNNPIEDPIENITIDYTRDIQVVDRNMDKFTFADEKEHLLNFRREEHLTIDRGQGFINYFNDKEGIVTTYNLEDKATVVRMLNLFSRHQLFKVSHKYFLGKQQLDGQSTGDYKKPGHDETAFHLTVTYKDGSEMKFYGEFNRNNLPFEYPEFIEMFRKVMTVKHKGDLFNPKLYKRGKVFPGEYMYCSVSINHSKKTYYYIGDDESLEIGDIVEVPVGKDEQVVVGKIKNIEFFTATETPLDVSQTKHIIGKHQ